jgi:hypothetical protein
MKRIKVSTKAIGLYYIVHYLVLILGISISLMAVTPYLFCFFFSCFLLASHERTSRHHERRWRGGGNSSRWPYNQKHNDSASSSVPRAVATTAVGTTLVVGVTGPIPGTSTPLPVRGHEACLLPCHGPCAASNQASACCKGFGAANNGHHHHSPTPSSPESSPHHREPHLILARKHQRVRKFPFSFVLLIYS